MDENSYQLGYKAGHQDGYQDGILKALAIVIGSLAKKLEEQWEMEEAVIVSPKQTS